jgi:hypothetical protein
MNQHGNTVFATGVVVGNAPEVDGTYRCDSQAQQLLLVARKGMPATQSLTLQNGGGGVSTINNRDEIALVAAVKSATGLKGDGVFFLGRDGKLEPVAGPGQTLPGGVTISQAAFTSINDDGRIAFLASPPGDENAQSAYVWEAGTITPVALVGAAAPGGGTIRSVRGVRVNNKDRTVLVALRVDNVRRDGLYRFADGKLTAVAIPGQEMPGGGKLQTLPEPGLPITLSGAPAVSSASEAGEHAFLARLEDGSTAAYRLKPTGELSLILKSGATTELGRVTRVGSASFPSIALNSRGQVAVGVKIEGQADTLVLLTATVP